MESTTKQGFVFDAGSLYAYFQTLKDSRKPKGLRYRLAGACRKFIGKGKSAGVHGQAADALQVRVFPVGRKELGHGELNLRGNIGRRLPSPKLSNYKSKAGLIVM